jgi:hypothetical protein
MKRFTLAALGVVTLLAFGGLSYAGRLPIPGRDDGRVAAFSTVTYTETFEGGERAVVTVRGDGSTRLDVYV